MAPASSRRSPSARIISQLSVMTFSSGKVSGGRKGRFGTLENRYMKQLTGARKVEWSVNWRVSLWRTLPRR